MVKDPISNLITNLKNAAMAGNKSIVVPFSNMNLAIIEVLTKEKYLSAFEINDKNPIKKIKVDLTYEEGEAAIHDVKRISKFSKRVYKGAKDILPVRRGYGHLILTTPIGVITDKTAREKNVGGEALFKIW